MTKSLGSRWRSPVKKTFHKLVPYIGATPFIPLMHLNAVSFPHTFTMTGHVNHVEACLKMQSFSSKALHRSMRCCTMQISWPHSVETSRTPC